MNWVRLPIGSSFHCHWFVKWDCKETSRSNVLHSANNTSSQAHKHLRHFHTSPHPPNLENTWLPSCKTYQPLNQISVENAHRKGHFPSNGHTKSKYLHHLLPFSPHTPQTTLLRHHLHHRGFLQPPSTTKNPSGPHPPTSHTPHHNKQLRSYLKNHICPLTSVIIIFLNDN